MVNRLVSKTGHVTGVMVTLQLPHLKYTESAEVAEMARDLAANIEAANPTIRVYITGMVSQELELLQR